MIKNYICIIYTIIELINYYLYMNKHYPLRVLYPLKARKIVKSGISGACKAIVALLLFAALIVWQSKGELSTIEVLNENLLLLSSLAFFFLLIGFAHPILYFVTYFYDIDNKNIIIRKGVIAKREIILPFSRITDVNVEQDFMDVLFGLYDIHISSPTAESGKFAHIDGLNKKSAIKIRNILVDKINSVGFIDSAESAQKQRSVA